MQRFTRILGDVLAGLTLFGLAMWAMTRNVGHHPIALSGKIPADLYAIELAMDEYAIHHEYRWPDSLDDLTRRETGSRPYLTSVPLDPWHRAYLLEASTGPGLPPRVFTLGRDGRPGGEGDDADLDGESFRVSGIDVDGSECRIRCTPARSEALTHVLP